MLKPNTLSNFYMILVLLILSIAAAQAEDTEFWSLVELERTIESSRIKIDNGDWVAGAQELESYLDAVGDYPEKITLYAQLGDLYYQNGEYLEAIKRYDVFLKNLPPYAEHVEESARRAEREMGDGWSASRYDFTYVSVLNNAGYAAIIHGCLAKARGYFERLTAIPDALGYVGLAQVVGLHDDPPDYELARQYLREAERLADREMPEIANILSDLEQQEGRKSQGRVR